MPYRNRHQSEDETERQFRALEIYLRRKFKKASFGEIATFYTNIALIIVGISAVIYGYQLSEMWRANDLTRQAIHAAELRPLCRPTRPHLLSTRCRQ
jgi:hypothetical protein